MRTLQDLMGETKAHYNGDLKAFLNYLKSSRTRHKIEDNRLSHGIVDKEVQLIEEYLERRGL